MSAHSFPHRLATILVSLAVLAALAVVGAVPAAAADASGNILFERVDWDDILESGLTTMRQDGSGQRTFTTADHEFFDDHAWSPEGSQIVVARGDTSVPEGRDLWLLDANGGSRTRLTSSTGSDFLPRWSPDGTTIAFTRSTEQDGPTDIWIVRSDGTGETRLTTTADRRELLVDWSPDGSRLLFESYPEAAVPFVPRIETMNVDGTSRATVIEARVRDLAWSPVGGRITYCREMGTVPNETGDGPAEVPTYDIWTMDHDGANQENLTRTATRSECGPQWTPHGQILYNAEGGIWVMDSDGNKKAKLGDGGGHALSPDGSMIAFTRAETTGSDSGTTSIWLMGADGSDPRQLTSGDYWDYGIAWQPIPIAGAAMVDTATGIWHLDGASFYYGNPGDHPMLGDWDCDGIETPGLYRQSDGYVYMRNDTTQGIADVAFFFGDPGDIPLAGDFDGDGCGTVSLYRPSEGKVYVINHLGSGDAGLGAADVSYYFGNPGDKPFAGDFDGDGVDTVGLHRESTGLVYFRNGHTPGPAEFQFVYGDPGDRLISHDWTGSGIDSVAVFRPTDSRLYFRLSNTPGIADATLAWGESHWMPVAGGY